MGLPYLRLTESDNRLELSLLCALDRIFDDATVFMIKGNSYRGKNCETIALSAGAPSALPKAQH